MIATGLALVGQEWQSSISAPTHRDPPLEFARPRADNLGHHAHARLPHPHPAGRRRRRRACSPALSRAWYARAPLPQVRTTSRIGDVNGPLSGFFDGAQALGHRRERHDRLAGARHRRPGARRRCAAVCAVGRAGVAGARRAARRSRRRCATARSPRSAIVVWRLVDPPGANAAWRAAPRRADRARRRARAGHLRADASPARRCGASVPHAAVRRRRRRRRPTGLDRAAAPASSARRRRRAGGPGSPAGSRRSARSARRSPCPRATTSRP